jgi:NADP-dependent 3-hydroxy acid dehydrogenase YdfG
METANRLKSLVMTGGSSGIGASFLKMAVEHFHDIHTLGRSNISSVSRFHMHHSLDLKSPIQPQLNLTQFPAAIDALVLCAGSDWKGRNSFLGQGFQIWEETIRINYLSTVELIHSLLPRVLESSGKTIVAVTSTNIEMPATGCLAYSSSKAALRAVLDNLRLEYASSGLRVIEVCPSLTQTNFALNRLQDAEKADKFYSSFKSVLQPEDVASSILWAIQQEARATISKIEIQPTEMSR